MAKRDSPSLGFSLPRLPGRSRAARRDQAFFALSNIIVFFFFFPRLFDKLDVNGPNRHPLDVARGRKKIRHIRRLKWNFGNFLIGRDCKCPYTVFRAEDHSYSQK